MIDRDRLREDAAAFGIALSDGMLEAFERYAAVLLAANEKMNLTAITDPREIEVKHLLDSILLLKAIDPPDGARVIDVGSGAGFPGIPLKIVRPDLRLALVDGVGKKVRFLEEASAALGQENLCLHGRAEELAAMSSHREQYDLATARAVAALPVLCECSLPLVKPGGAFLAMKGREVESELEECRNAVRLLGGAVARIEKLTLPLEIGRSLVVLEKRSQTPSKYPRKYAQIIKQPL